MRRSRLCGLCDLCVRLFKERAGDPAGKRSQGSREAAGKPTMSADQKHLPDVPRAPVDIFLAVMSSAISMPSV